jgi:hypothetical protein
MSEDSLLDLEREEVELKQELLRLQQIKENQLRSRALEFFIPHAGQLPFFQNADKQHRAGYCGNRFGKSTLGVVEDCSWAIGERPFFKHDNPLRRLGIPRHGVKGLVLSEDWDKVHEIFTNSDSADRPGKFFEYLPKDKIVGTTRMQKGIINSINVRNFIDGHYRDSTIVFDTVRSFINNPRSFESSDWDFIHVDEPLMEELWRAVSRGLIDRGGKEWWLMTPLGFPWMYEYSLERVQKTPEKSFMFEASMDDNPTLDEDTKQTYLMQLPDDEREARQKGKPLAYGRRVYGHYEDKVHLWNKKDKNGQLMLPHGWVAMNHPPPSYLCGYALDPHPQTPHAVLFIALAPTGEIFIYDELFEKLLIKDLAQEIITKRNRIGHLGWELCDPTAWIVNPDTGSCWAHTLMSAGLNIIRASKDKTSGIMQTQQIFAPSYPRKVWLMPHCTRFQREIKSYFFDRENKPVDKDDHMMENLYRTVVHNNLTYYPPPPKRRTPLVSKDEFSGTQDYNIKYETEFKI